MKIFDSLKSIPNKIVLYFFVLFFIILRLPGIYLPYHQDEWKTAWGLESGQGLQGLHHPPLTQIFYYLDDYLFGVDNLRLMPLLFSFLCLILLFFVIKNRSGIKAAYIGIFLFIICFYSVFASLMIDTDGAILPFFFLLSIYFYDNFKNREEKKFLWLTLLLSSLFLGFFTKLSFIIVIGAVVFDFLLEYRKKLSKKHLTIGAIFSICFLIFSGLALIIVKSIYPSFNLDAMISHAASYIHLGERNFLQIIVQGVKAIFYLSPVLVIPIIFTNKEVFRKQRVFFLYLLLGFLFYFVLFDFSQGALDKYLMFAIVPLVVISASILGNFITKKDLNRKDLIIAGALSFCVFILNFLSPDLISLYPKGDWFNRVVNLEWNMLNPFTGGNGPIGFYISFLFIGFAFLVSSVFGIIGFLKKEYRASVCVIIIFVSVFYNLVFIEEMFFGKINGNSKYVLEQTINFIYKNESKKVITYNDSGAFELSRIGKYFGRFYAAPQFENNHKVFFSQNKDVLFMVIDIPHIYNGFYKDFLNKCEILFSANSGKINSYVYDCRKD